MFLDNKMNTIQPSYPLSQNLYNSKMIWVINPYTNERFRIELSGEEKEFRELLGSLFQINPSFIKGLRDSYNNHYTISSALKSPYIQTNYNTQFTLVISSSEKGYNQFHSSTQHKYELMQSNALSNSHALPSGQTPYKYKNSINNQYFNMKNIIILCLIVLILLFFVLKILLNNFQKIFQIVLKILIKIMIMILEF